jgi:transcriptional regulator with GAF, ATPase, and Fis domain
MTRTPRRFVRRRRCARLKGDNQLMTVQNSMRSTDAYDELGRINFSQISLDEGLSRVAQLAKRTIARASDVSITLVGPGGAHTAAFTGELALALDEWQYESGHGPCLAAAAANITVPVADVAGDSRWPAWSSRAIDAGAHSLLSVGLPLHNCVTGALNVYWSEPDAFDDEAVILAQTFAGYAAVAMATTHPYDGVVSPGQRTRAAMESRAVIEQAKGIVMGDRRCTADEASAILANISHYSHRTVRDVAVALVSRAADGPARLAGTSTGDIVAAPRAGNAASTADVTRG